MRFSFRRLSDADLMEGIGDGGAQGRLFENQLYERYSYFIRDGVRKHRLSEDECASAYTDALLSVIEHVRTGRFEGRSAPKTYLYQIFNNKCVDLIRKKTTNRQSVHDTVPVDDALLQLPADLRPAIQQLIDQQEGELLQQRLRMLSEKCRDMLLAWSEGYSDEEIARTVGYQSADVAKTSRLRCLERLRELYRPKKS